MQWFEVLTEEREEHGYGWRIVGETRLHARLGCAQRDFAMEAKHNNKPERRVRIQAGKTPEEFIGRLFEECCEEPRFGSIRDGRQFRIVRF